METEGFSWPLRAAILAVVCLGILSVLGGAVIAEGIAADEPEEPIEVDYTFTWEQEGSVTIEIVVTIPAEYVEREGTFSIDPASHNAPVDCETGPGFASGFRSDEWDGDSETMELSCEADAPLENPSFGGYDSYTAEDWAFIRFGSTPTYTEEGESMNHLIVRRANPESVIGEHFTFVGEHEIRIENVGDKEIRLIVPETAELSEDPDTIVESLAYEARTVRVGGHTRADAVIMFAAPDPIRGGGQAFLDSGDGWVGAGGSLAWNSWGHEYIHTRQVGEYSSDTMWLLEAEARYYQHLLSYKQGHLSDRYWRHDDDFDAFQSALQRGSDHGDVVLSDQGTWESLSNYEKGALVLAALDAEIRDETNGESTYQDVMREHNRQTGTDLDDFQRAIEDVTGDPMDEFVDRYITGTDIPDPPSDESIYTQGDLDWDVSYDVEIALPDGEAVAIGDDVMIPVRLEHAGTDPAIGVEFTVTGDRVGVVTAENGTLVDETATWSTTEFGPTDRFVDTITLDIGEDLAGEEGTVQVVVGDSDGANAVFEQTISGVEPPTVTAIEGDDLAIDDDELTLGASIETGTESIDLYKWDLTGDGKIDATTSTPEYVWEDASPGRYTVTVVAIDEKGFSDRASMDVVVTDTPAVTPVLPEGPITDSESVRFEAGVENTIGDVDIVWELPDGTTETADILETMFEPGEQTLTLRVTDEYGAETTETIEVLVTDVPAVELETPADAVIEGEPIDLDVTVTNEIGEYDVTWTLPDGETVEGEAITTSIEPGEHDVTIIVEDEHDASATGTETVLVTDQPTLTLSVPESVTAGDEIELEAIVENDIGEVTVQWMFEDGTELTGPVVAHEFTDGDQDIEVIAVDEYGAATVAEVTVDVTGDATTADPGDDQAPGFVVPGTVGAVITVGGYAWWRRRTRAG